MKVLIDANVLYPTVMRELVLGVAAQGAFEPLWSARLLEEWARAARKRNIDDEMLARGEITRLSVAWPKASVTWGEGLEARLWLPDPNDIHVLAAAISGSADVILTQNAKDFPRNILSEEGVSRADPDGFILGIWQAQPEAVQLVASRVLQKARELSGNDWTMRRLLKKARLPRLAKALDA
ncbi:MAG: PIN domain-containing protein [Paracoccaceae bacterium]